MKPQVLLLDNVLKAPEFFYFGTEKTRLVRLINLTNLTALFSILAATIENIREAHLSSLIIS